MTKDELIALADRTGPTPTCSDLDEDCDDIAEKVHCYLYDPVRGMCPYLRSHASSLGE